MSNTNVSIAEGYYVAMGERNEAGMKKFLHENVKFSSPLAKLEGREAVLNAAVKFSFMLESIKIRAKCSSADHVMLAFDMKFHAPIGIQPAAVLMTIKDQLITSTEIFFDVSSLEKK